MGAVLQAQGRCCHERASGTCRDETDLLLSTSPCATDAEDKERILRALKQANGNRSVAAELLGIGRTTLYSKLEEYGLKYKFKQS